MTDIGSGLRHAVFDIMGTPATNVAKQVCVHTPLRARVPGGFENSTITTVVDEGAIRRLTPLECETIQGLPHKWTLVPHRGGQPADCPRYKAIGNSMAVPVMIWLGERIQMAEGLSCKT